MACAFDWPGCDRSARIGHALRTVGDRLAVRGDLFRGVLTDGQDLPAL